MNPRCKIRQRRRFDSSPIVACLALLSLTVPLTLTVTTNASAVGFGPFFEYSHGNGKLDVKEFFGTNVFSVNHLDIESDKYAVGVAIDTNVAANRLFNYRLNIRFARTHRDLDDFDVLDLSVCVGASLGVNIHSGPLVSLASTTGYQYVFISELVQYENTRGESRSELLDGYEHVVKAGVTVFFRTPGDRF